MLGQAVRVGHYNSIGIMHEVNFLQDLAVVMISAGIVTLLFQRLKQPVVLGYIVAGILIGPNFSALLLGEDSFRFVHDRDHCPRHYHSHHHITFQNHRGERLATD